MKYLILIFLSILSINTFAAGGSFGGGGASGSWGGDSCPVQYIWKNDYVEADTPAAACSMHPELNGWKNAGYEHTSQTEVACLSKKDGITIQNGYVNKILNPKYSSDCNTCPVGYDKLDGKCVPKKCPLGETLVNGQCQKKQCPAGQALDLNGNCMPRDDQCPAGQIMVNGRCTQDPNAGDDPPPPPPEWPAFCEWASVMCQWHKEWQQWSNDYAANEQKANLDREELKRLSLDSKEQLTEINSKQEAIKEAIQTNSLTLDKIKD